MAAAKMSSLLQAKPGLPCNDVSPAERKGPKLWHFPCMGNVHMHVQTWDLGEGFGKPALTTCSLECNEKSRFLFHKALFILFLELIYLSQQKEKGDKKSIKTEGEFNSES